MSRIRRWWDKEKPQHFLWLPVAFGTGIALYFLMPDEPQLAYLIALTVISTIMLVRKKPKLSRIAFALVMMGATWAALHTSWQHGIIIKKSITPRPVTGRLIDMERVEKGMRFTLEDVTIAGMDPKETPARVRLSVRVKAGTSPELPHIGDKVSMLAGLLPPMGPALPGGFDFARYFFFRGIGAVGYGLPPWKVTEPAAESNFMQWRFALTERIITKLGPTHGPIAAGLITGEDRAITEQDFQDLRASNLYHIIAISGSHMVVIAGVIFLGLRWLLLFIPRHGQRPGIKSFAAAVTLVLVTAYLFVTGMPISAVRAYIMIVLVLLAVILRREVDAMRSLALAVLIMLIIDPSDLLEPGFILSFVATLAIIALIETTWLRAPKRERSFISSFGRVILTMFLISVVAEGATGPLVASMFNTLSPYGVLANMVATPLVAFVIMPAVALFFILLPFGLEDHALVLMDYAVQALMGIARYVAELPNAQLFVPSPPTWGIALFVAGLLFLCLVRQRERLLGFAAIAIGIASVATVKLPDLLVGQEVKQIVIRTPEGYKLVRGRAGSMLPELWANGLGYKELESLKPGTDPWRCDPLGCLAKIDDTYFSFPNGADAFDQDCDHVSLVFTTLVSRCPSTRTVNKFGLRYGGVHAVWLDEMRVENSKDWQGNRPWSAYGFKPTGTWSPAPRPFGASTIRR